MDVVVDEKIWVIEMEMIPDKLWNDFFSEFLRDTFETSSFASS